MAGVMAVLVPRRRMRSSASTWSIWSGGSISSRPAWTGRGSSSDQAKCRNLPIISSCSRGPGRLDPEIRKKFGYLYLYYLLWQNRLRGISTRRSISLQSWLKQLLALKGSNFQWLVVWVEKQSGLPPVTLRRNSGEGACAVVGREGVMPAFTKKGKELIDSFMKEIGIGLA